MIYLLCLILGVTAGLRAVTPLAAISWGAFFGWLALGGTWAAFVGNIATAIVLGLMALIEYVGDQLPQTPPRKSPPAFAGRIVTGALSGLLLGLPTGAWAGGLVAGIIGAVFGTLGGYEARMALAARLGRDLPAGIIEDIVALVVAFAVVYAA
jgi:uncharacterized membrane protein